MTERGRSSQTDETSRLQAELRQLRARVKRHETTLDGLAQAVLTLRAGSAALKAQNRELAAENLRLRRDRHRPRSAVLRNKPQHRSSAAAG
jgi:hypothetical protein